MAKGPSLPMQSKMLFVVTAIVAVAFSALVGRLVYLQIIDGNYLEKLAVNQQLSEITVSAKRGTIYDRNMKPLAESATVWTVYACPSYIPNDETRKSIAKELSTVLDLDEETVYKKISKNTGYVIIKKKVEKASADLISDYVDKKNLSCVGLVEDSKRYYPYGSFLSQVLGFTGTDNQGLAGLEAEYESVLKGVSGKLVTAKNALGINMPFEYDDYVAPEDGDSLVLTVDEVVQHYLEKYLSEAYVEDKVQGSATGIVMNVNTGEILGMATEQDYDPNNPFELTAKEKSELEGLTGTALSDKKTELLEEKWNNTAISFTYEPGSCFKIITAAAGLEEGAVTENTHFYDPGYIYVAGTKFKCWKSGGHGDETFVEGLKNSCNPVFISVAETLGAVKYYKYFEAFGFTSKTGIDLPGEASTTGLYHTLSGLGKVELASTAFGQTFKITPIQLITAVCAVANGGNLVTPHIVSKIVDSDGNIVKSYETTTVRQVISETTSKELCNMLQQVVSKTGTGKNAYVSGYRIAGKTGTSQKIDKDGGKSLRIASFIGFAPADDPQYAVIVVIDEPNSTLKSGGVLAAPVVANVFEDILPYLGVETKYTSSELAKLDVTTPDLTGKSITAAKSVLKKLGLSCRIIGSGDKVLCQNPSSGEPIPSSGRVVISTESDQISTSISVPDVTGMTVSQVNARLTNDGLNVRLVGSDLTNSGIASYDQDPAAGTKVKAGTVISVSFRDNTVSVD